MTDFDQIIDRRGTGSVKWDKYRDRDVLPLWVADMDFRSPPAVIEALHERVSHGIFGYTSPPDELADAVVDHLRTEFDWETSIDWLVWLPGLVTGLNVASRAVGSDGDDVATLVPVYPPFLSAPHLTGRRLVTVRLEQTNGRWGIDFDRLERSITPRTRLFMLCNPHNPSGQVYSREELLQMAGVCLKNDTVMVSDEIHSELLLGGSKHAPLGTLSPEIAQRSITLIAPSKTFNIAGLFCGFAIIPNPELRERYTRAVERMTLHVASLAQVAAQAAFSGECDDWLVALRAYLTNNRDYLVDFVEKNLPGVQITIPQATYLAWLDCRAAGISGNPYEFFLKEARVALNDGGAFGQGGEGFVRLNFGCPRPVLEEGPDIDAREPLGLSEGAHPAPPEAGHPGGVAGVGRVVLRLGHRAVLVELRCQAQAPSGSDSEEMLRAAPLSMTVLRPTRHCPTANTKAPCRAWC